MLSCNASVLANNSVLPVPIVVVPLKVFAPLKVTSPFSVMLPPLWAIPSWMGPTTSMYIVARLDKPPKSVALTWNVFVPASELAGVPESAPLGATASQAGPLATANVIVSPKFGSVALVEIVAE